MTEEEKQEQEGMLQTIARLTYENENMAEFIKFNNRTLTDDDVGDIATSVIENGIWDRFLNRNGREG